MTIFTIAGRKRHTVIHCRKTAQDAYRLQADMIADGFKNVCVTERRI